MITPAAARQQSNSGLEARSVTSPVDIGSNDERSLKTPAIAIAGMLVLVTLFKIGLVSSYRDESGLLDEGGYYYTFLGSHYAGHFKLNCLTVSSTLGYYWLWELWASIFGTSLLAARLLATMTCLLGFIGTVFLAREWGLKLWHAVLATCLVVGLPLSVFTEYVMTDGLFFACCIWFWWCVMRVARTGQLRYAVPGFALLIFAATFRQIAPFVAIAGVLYLIATRYWPLAARIAICAMATGSVLAAEFTIGHLQSDPLFCSIQWLKKECGGFALYTPGAICLFAWQVLGSILSIFEPLLLLLFYHVLFNRPRLYPSFWILFGVFALPRFGTIFSILKRSGLVTAVSQFSGQFCLVDYGGPTVVNGNTLGILLSILGFLFWVGGTCGLAYAISCLWRKIREKQWSEFFLHCLFFIPVAATIAATVSIGMPVFPRYFLPAAVIPLHALCHSIRAETKLLTKPIAVSTALCSAVIVLFGVFSYRDALATVATSWDVRLDAEKRLGLTHPLISLTQTWGKSARKGASDGAPFGEGHPETQTLANSYSQTPDYWKQSGPARIHLGFFDPWQGAPSAQAVSSKVLHCWFTPKSISWEASVEMESPDARTVSEIHN